MAKQLSPYRLRKARDAYNYFNVFNAVSWNLLVGIIITLFALRLGATSTYIGLMSATFYIALFLLPLGKVLTRRFSIIGIFCFTWIVRSICMILAVIAPFFDYAGQRNTALLLIMLGVLFFHLFRGIGMIGNNPVLSSLASGPDKGSYLTQLQIINSAIGMFGSFIIAMVLGMEPPIFVFSILLSLGVITGIISGAVIRKVPEPGIEESIETGGRKKKLTDIFKDALSQDYLRHFMLILFLVVMVSGVTRTFIVVYAREVFEHNDGLISLYSVFGGFGFLMAGMIVKFLVDRLGAKPLFLVCVILGLVSLIFLVFFPYSAIENMTGSILFMVFLFFMLHFGFLGSEGIAQTYFLALIPPQKALDMGILYFFIFGIAGAGGTFAAGLFIDFFLLIGVSPFTSFKILFIIMILLTVIALARQSTMKSLGSLSLKGALDVIFSVRDLRAISLLDKLNKAQDSDEENLLLGALHDTPSHLAIDGLLERVRSPRLATRLEAIRALEKLHVLGKNAEKALLEDVTNNLFTTAYISARILGKHNCKDAIPKLRELASCGDYMLAGESIISLSKMKDEEFRPEIEKIILDTQNPRLKIMGAEALGFYRNADSLLCLLEILRRADPHLYLRDEAILAMAAILGTQRQFYSVHIKYVANNSLANTLCFDETEAALEYCKSIIGNRKNKKINPELTSHIDNFHNAVTEYLEKQNGLPFSNWILELPEPKHKLLRHKIEGLTHDESSKNPGVIKTVLSQAILDEELSTYNCLRLLIIHWAAQQLRIWAIRVK
ncbi:MAG: MFS transporter [Treponema sp.]|nr:MFS transporter [Treponema sp.]